MKNFACTHCGSRVYFENVQCLRCLRSLGFCPEALEIMALEPARGRQNLYRRIKGRDLRLVRYCANAEQGACNWLTRSDDPNTLCKACSLNRTIPNLTEPGSLQAWQELERAKKRLVYELLRLQLPLDATSSGKGRLTFDFARDALTGHLDGVITIDIMEADAVERERQRQHFDEPYRSLLGHLRHESGHFYWSVLVEIGAEIDAFRTLFGDEREDYGSALARHHAIGPPTGWQERYVSAYASSHPWEDWAETWAHYLHILAALDTAEANGMEPRATRLIFGSHWPFGSYDIYREETFGSLMDRWVPLSIAMNSISRSMGHNDYYPFVIPAGAYNKLSFVHRVARTRAMLARARA